MSIPFEENNNNDIFKNIQYKLNETHQFLCDTSVFNNGSYDEIKTREQVLFELLRLIIEDCSYEQKLFYQKKSIILQNEILALKQEAGIIPQEKFSVIWRDFQEKAPDKITNNLDKQIIWSFIKRINASLAPDNIKQYWQNKADAMFFEYEN